ncbi:hypothetical protein BSPWISOXPB_9328 [uncultured Gammaproteobacteria bacterium]|nr:hypothetical protein BSPWISOXPB_9328 [uncultured Gammaproteobacteria bacterium]
MVIFYTLGILVHLHKHSTICNYKQYGNTASTQFYGGGSIKMYCEIQFQVNSKGFIKKLAILKDHLGWGSIKMS